MGESENKPRAKNHKKDLTDTVIYDPDEVYVLPSTPIPVRKPSPTWHKVLGFFAGALALISLATFGFLSQYYKNKVMPGVSVAGFTSSGIQKPELKKQLSDRASNFKVTVQYKGKQFTPKLKDIGFTFDTQATANQAMRAKRTNLLDRLFYWKKVSVPATFTFNKAHLVRYTETNFPSMVQLPKDARLVFSEDTQKFKVTNEKPGTGADIEQLESKIKNAASTFQSTNIVLTQATKTSKLTALKLQPLIEPANKLIEQTVTLTSDTSTFYVGKKDIASWVTIKPNLSGTLSLYVDKAKIAGYVEGLSKQISTTPQDKKVLKDDDTNEVVVIQAGKNGTELAGRDELAQTIVNSLSQHKDVVAKMKIKTAPYKTVSMDTYKKWMEVDLSTQTMVAYEKAKPVRNFIVATGMSGYETPPGEYAVWLKIRKQTMTGGSKASGDYYSIPNVEWVNYFYGDYAIHGAWWREVFGYPASHGCVNISNKQAQWVYNWAPIGTKVIVHY